MNLTVPRDGAEQWMHGRRIAERPRGVSASPRRCRKPPLEESANAVRASLAAERRAVEACRRRPTGLDRFVLSPGDSARQPAKPAGRAGRISPTLRMEGPETKPAARSGARHAQLSEAGRRRQRTEPSRRRARSAQAPLRRQRRCRTAAPSTIFANARGPERGSLSPARRLPSASRRFRRRRAPFSAVTRPQGAPPFPTDA